MTAFDPNSASSSEEGIYGLPFKSAEEAQLVVLPVEFDATTSFRPGTSKAPARMLKASEQVDLYHPLYPEAWKKGIFCSKAPEEILKWNEEARQSVAIARETDESDSKHKEALKKVNALTTKMNEHVYKESKKLLDQGKVVGLIGGDHSVSESIIKAHFEKYPKMGVLHFDAHYDLRKAYEGFQHSHASVMRNVMDDTDLKSLTSVGIRDFCEEEVNYVKSSGGRVIGYSDTDIVELRSAGRSWRDVSRDIIESMPKSEVYVSFDIDGLDPTECPATGTPVPGGLKFNEAVYLLREILSSGRKIVGFDVVEVGDADYDANVGVRLLYELAVLSIVSRSRAEFI